MLYSPPAPFLYFLDYRWWDNYAHLIVSALITWLGDYLVVSLREIVSCESDVCHDLTSVDLPLLPDLEKECVGDRRSYHSPHWQYRSVHPQPLKPLWDVPTDFTAAALPQAPLSSTGTGLDTRSTSPRTRLPLSST